MFSINLHEIVQIEIIQVAIFLIIMDIFIDLNSGYYDKGNIEINRIKIIKNYIKNSLFIEIISILPVFVEIFGFKYSHKYLNLIFLLKLDTI